MRRHFECSPFSSKEGTIAIYIVTAESGTGTGTASHCRPPIQQLMPPGDYDLTNSKFGIAIDLRDNRSVIDALVGSEVLSCSSTTFSQIVIRPDDVTAFIGLNHSTTCRLTTFNKHERKTTILHSIN